MQHRQHDQVAITLSSRGTSSIENINLRKNQLLNIYRNKNYSYGSNKKLRRTNLLNDQRTFNRKINLGIDKSISRNEITVQKQDKNRNKKPD